MRIRAVILFFCALMLLSSNAVCSAWPGYVEGRPYAFDPGDNFGFFIWHDEHGFHLRTTTFRLHRHFSGTIRSNGRFFDVDERRTEGRDRVHISRNDRKLDFDLYTSGGTDGLDFKVKNADWIQFELLIDGHQMTSERIFLGLHGRHPRDNDFRLYNRPLIRHHEDHFAPDSPHPHDDEDLFD